MAASSFDEALALHQSGRIAEAEAIYRQVLEQQPDHPGALHLLGVVRQQQGDYAAALELIGRAIAINPRKAVYRNNYGAALQSLGRHEEAAESFQRALTISPNYADALANLGMAQASLGEDSAAETSFRRALVCQAWHRDAVTRLAALLRRQGRAEEARHLLESAIAAAPCPEFRLAMGDVWLATRDRRVRGTIPRGPASRRGGPGEGRSGCGGSIRLRRQTRYCWRPWWAGWRV